MKLVFSLSSHHSLLARTQRTTTICFQRPFKLDIFTTGESETTMKPTSNNTILWRRAPPSLQQRTATSSKADEDGVLTTLPTVVSSPSRQHQHATTTHSNNASSATINNNHMHRHHHHHHHHVTIRTMVVSSASHCCLRLKKKSLYCQWMTVLMFAVFVSTLSIFRWNKDHRFFQKQQQFHYSMMTMMTASMSTTTQYPSSVTLSKLDSTMIHAPLPPPPKQKLVVQKGKDNKNDTTEPEEEAVMQVVSWNPDYGGINVRLMMVDDDDDDEKNNASPPQQQPVRPMYRNGDDLRNSYLSKGDGDDEIDFYYLVDDDVARNPYNGWDDDQVFEVAAPKKKDSKQDSGDEEDANKKKRERKQCRRTSWQETVYPNCNTFHEFDFSGLVADLHAKHLGAGSFRDVFVAETGHDQLVFKESSYENAHGRYNYKDFHFVRKDGVIAAQLQPHPLIVDTYGWCQLSLFGEYMPMGDMYKTAIPVYKKCKNMTKDIEFQKDLVMMNNLTATEKLEYALQMAETISVLNNYENGVIVHDDVQLVQFLLAPNGKLKLNDFNRMEVMYFDEENQEYCRYRNNPGHGPWRAPEEYFDWPLDEKIDIWSLGNMFYSMMTGMYPFYHECSSKAVQKRVKKKETPFIDPRWRKHSFAEAALVKVIRQCWAYRPADRIDIGSMVLQLREAVEENQARHRKAKQRQKSRTRGEIETTTQAAG